MILVQRLIFAFGAVCLLTLVHAQAPKKLSSADIFEQIRKLQVLGSVMYIAAHPDDENTRLISYFANHRYYHTTYLSMTRGDGGQNLIGPEMAELVGVIRTQELLMARSIDRGNQMFTRANDFGYSKHPDETLKIWDHDEVLSDVVWAIRKQRPDIIINRFDHRTPGRTHGHHTSSAMLAVEAFDVTADRTYYPAQLEYVETWQPERIFFNTTWWFYGSRENFDKLDKSNLTSVDVGVYYPVKGKSNTEIASESISMHKSQGFGMSFSVGSLQEYLELIKGSAMNHGEDPLEGVNTGWSRLEGGKPIEMALKRLEEDFLIEDPSASIPRLLDVRKMMLEMPEDGFWVPMKIKEIDELIRYCAGILVEAIAEEQTASVGKYTDIQLEVINRSRIPVALLGFSFNPEDSDTLTQDDLIFNEQRVYYTRMNIPRNSSFSSPYWLSRPWQSGMYRVEDQRLRGLPESPSKPSVNYRLNIAGTQIAYNSPIVYRTTDPVQGEIYKPFEITPPVFLNLDQSVYVFTNNDVKNVSVRAKAGSSNLNGKLSLRIPYGWSCDPPFQELELDEKGQEVTISFKIRPPEKSQEGTVMAQFVPEDSKQDTFNHFLTVIQYDHIPLQTILLPSESKLVKLDLVTEGKRIGYIMGAGDNIPACLEGIGYEVVNLEESDLTPDFLRQFDAVIAGIRAYNTNDRLKHNRSGLMDYVRNGGTYIVQYITTRDLSTNELGPYPFRLSHDRVSVETAEIEFLDPEHPALNFPNKITHKDFDGWVQERGLYFADQWDDHYETILSSHDPGESPKEGGLLIAKFGQGTFVYTGYSWFRQLPAGVPGAYRLFTNLISFGNHKQP